MKICIPTINANGQSSEVCEHFGSAPYFTIYDYQANEYETVNNLDREHKHGACQPMEHLKDKDVNCVVCKGLGKRALEKLNGYGIKVFRIDQSTVKDVVEDFSNSTPEEIKTENACQNHKCH